MPTRTFGYYENATAQYNIQQTNNDRQHSPEQFPQDAQKVAGAFQN